MILPNGERSRRPGWPKLLLGATAGVLVILIGVALTSVPKGPLAEVAVSDGRIIVIEAVTYGTNHAVGTRSLLVERFGPWLPRKLRDLLSPKVPETSINTQTDTLVVWLNALDPHSRTNIDCQKLRLEFEDQWGDLWAPPNSFWHAYENHFIRIGHTFEAYPRAAKELTLRITPWRSTNTVTVKFPNPNPVTPAIWTGQPPPLRFITNNLEVVLADLRLQTNGGPDQHWETPARYWKPEWRLLFADVPASGWHEPEWEAFDPMGNRGQFLGIHQPALRYFARFVPLATNELATASLATLTATTLAGNATNALWFKTNRVGGKEFVAIGLLTSTMNFFTDGEYQAVAPVPIGPTRGGAKTGWVSSVRRVSPINVLTHRGHYADRPVIYLQCRDAELAKNLGVRVRDEQGRLWPTTREQQGNPDGILAFMLDGPPDAASVTPEIVLLKPVEAEFTVRTPVAPMP